MHEHGPCGMASVCVRLAVAWLLGCVPVRRFRRSSRRLDCSVVVSRPTPRARVRAEPVYIIAQYKILC